MKISTGKIQSFISNFDEKLIGALIYGPDNGAVQKHAESISKKIVTDLNDPFNVINLDDEKIEEEVTTISDEFNSISFGGGRKLLRLRNSGGNKDVAKATEITLESLQDESYKDAFLLVTASDLANTSPLRKLFEKDKRLASLACYAEEGRTLSAKIALLMQKNKLSPEVGVVEYLNEYCHGNSKILENEIEKLSLYKQFFLKEDIASDKDLEFNDVYKVTLEDVLNSTGNNSETNLNDLTNKVLDIESHKNGKIQFLLKDALISGLAPIAIIRSMQRYFEKLHFALDNYNNGDSIEQAISSLRPPVFFKLQPIMKRDLTVIVNKAEGFIFNLYDLLFNAEVELKKTGANPDLITSRLFHDIFLLVAKKTERKVA
jgi:DNA polymerase-3 subunit delta